MTNKILIVEDEENLGVTLKDYLNEYDFECQLVKTISDAKNLLKNNYHCIILDIGLPDGNGLDLAKIILNSDKNSRIIFLSAQNSPDIKLEGLELGASDYITKPFRLKELLLRINKLPPSSTTNNSTKFIFGPLKFNPENFEIQDAHNLKTSLSERENKILCLLIKNKNKVVSRDQIIEKIWGEDSYPSNRTVDNYIVKFRKWTDTANDYVEIQNIRGVGYKFLVKKGN